ncbi:MAG: hypothetical protein V4733_07575 [Verrucomicrobiota bacterium]
MKKRKLITAFIVVAAAAWAAWHFRGLLHKDDIIEYGKSTPAWALIVAFVFLPLFGFPITIPLIVAGLRFGFWWGALLSLVCIYLHHLIAFALCRGTARRWLRSKLPEGKWSLPGKGGQIDAWTVALFAAIHGPPYFIKLYLLALTNPRFVVFTFVGGTVYWLFGLIPLGAAAAAKHVDVTWIYIGITIASVAMLWWKWRRSKKTPEKQSGES